jgi:hypothetical protein
MNDTPNNVDPKNKDRAIFDEADIGSGERSPGQHDTEKNDSRDPGTAAGRQR